jgi:hypothetical protein
MIAVKKRLTYRVPSLLTMPERLNAREKRFGSSRDSMSSTVPRTRWEVPAV